MGSILSYLASNPEADHINEAYRRRVKEHEQDKVRESALTEDQATRKLARFRSKRPSQVPQAPSHIVDELYLGNMYDCLSPKVLTTHNIRNLVNCTKIVYEPNIDGVEIAISHMGIEDDESENIFALLPAQTKFIAEAKGPTLVHCEHGVSRSATVCIAFLMKYHSMSALNALLLVRKCRKVVCPNEAFLEALVDWEDLLATAKGSKTGKTKKRLNELKAVFKTKPN